MEDLKGKLISKNGMAMSNQYSVEMPSEVGSGLDGGVKTKLKGMSGTTANLLCKSVSMPGKQITTLDRQIGIFSEKVVNGFAVDDVTMTFYALNDYGAKKYFDTWRSAMLGEYAVPKEEPNEEEEGEPKPPKPTPLPKSTGNLFDIKSYYHLLPNKGATRQSADILSIITGPYLSLELFEDKI